MSQYKILYCDSGKGMLARRQALGAQVGALGGAGGLAQAWARRRACWGVQSERAGACRASVLGRAGRQALAGARGRASGSWAQAQARAGGRALGVRQAGAGRVGRAA